MATNSIFAVFQGTPAHRLATALAGWLRRLECHSIHQKVVVLVPSQGTYLSPSLIPGQGVYRKQQIDISLLHRCFSLSLPSFLSKINKHILC